MEDLDRLMDIFEQSKRIMRKSGNLKQWTGSYKQQTNQPKNTFIHNTFIIAKPSADLLYLLYRQ